jgi:DnaD/phage-associated family protein
MTPGDDRGRGRPVSIPEEFFERVLPRVRDVAELKVLLSVYRHSADDSANAPFVAEDAIYGDASLLEGLRLQGSTLPPFEDVRRGIDLALAHEALVRFWAGDDEGGESWLVPASPENRLRLAAVQRGERAAPAREPGTRRPVRIELERPNVFRLYEQNIGLVTPIIADQLIEAIEIYPEQWLEEAITESVSYNRRSWRYVQRILERWVTEGRGDETDQRHSPGARPLDPEKYRRGKYASLFKRRD